MTGLCCPHCEKELALDDGAAGEFICPGCNGEFLWEGTAHHRRASDIYDRRRFFIGLGVPNLMLLAAWCLAALMVELGGGGGHVFWLVTFGAFGVWISLFVHGLRHQQKELWQGVLAALLLAPITTIGGGIVFIVATDWTMFYDKGSPSFKSEIRVQKSPVGLCRST